MLCPEVSYFQEPSSLFQSKIVDQNSLSRQLDEFNFVHLVTAIIPDTLKIPDSLSQILTNSDYYKVKALNVADLISVDFIESFVQSGDLSLLSINTRIDCDNCLAITKDGKLVLSLDKVTYQTLGLEGKVSGFHTATKEKYVVTIDLKAPAFKPGKPNFERTRNRLRELVFEVIVLWDPPAGDFICPSSVAKYFADLGYDVALCTIKAVFDTMYSLKVPEIGQFEDLELDACSQIAEWLGMVSLNGNMVEKESFVSTYETPEPSSYLGQVKVLRWRGFFSGAKVAEFLNHLQASRVSTMWKAVYFQGFSDAPVVWGSKEHHYYTNGDNAALILLNEKQYLMCLQKCTNKRYH